LCRILWFRSGFIIWSQRVSNQKKRFPALKVPKQGHAVLGSEEGKALENRLKHCNGFNERVAGNNSINTIQHAAIEEAVFSVDPSDAPIDWLDSGHVMCLL
jgi:hypothetical protein